MDEQHDLPTCHFCDGDGFVVAQPGDVEMGCPFCRGAGFAKPLETSQET